MRLRLIINYTEVAAAKSGYWQCGTVLWRFHYPIQKSLSSTIYTKLDELTLSIVSDGSTSKVMVLPVIVYRIVEDYNDGCYEIEFSNDRGETIALCPLPIQQFIILWKAKSKTWLSLTEKLTALIDKLAKEKQEKIGGDSVVVMAA